MRTELVTTLKRQATKILKQLEKDEPILITQHGVTQHISSMLRPSRTTTSYDIARGIARGEKAIEEGRSLTNKQAKQRMSRWLK